MMRRSIEVERDAVIEDVKLYTNNRYLLDEIKECHKMTELTDTPEGIQDLIVVTANIENKKGEREKVTDFFPVIIKYDGTLQTRSLTKRNRLWRTRFMGFLKHYGLTENIKSYVIPVLSHKCLTLSYNKELESEGVDRDWDRLKRWIIKKKLQGWSVTEICTHAQISRDMFYRWWNRCRAEGWGGLEERPRGRPKGFKVSVELRRKIVKLRKRYEWGPNKIEGYLKQRGFNVSHNRIYRIICEEGLNNPITEPRKTWGKKRFERKHSNSLWQADFKLCEDDYWMISFQDDHSRFITGSTKVWNPTGKNAIQLLQRSVKRFGGPTQVLTDQGTQFKPARGELSEFTRCCSDLGIQHITASKRRPTTIGKIEAFHKAYVNESRFFNKHWTFIRYYNYKRPHEALNYLTPAIVYVRDLEV